MVMAVLFLSIIKPMNLSNPFVHEIDTRQNSTVTIFDGSRDDESKLAKQFWNSVVLMPPVESTLVCKEIQQRTRSRALNDGTNKPRLPASMIKANQEKTMRNKEHEEAAAMKEAEDEGKRIQITRQRHQQLRQLFFKQARTNRMKHEEWSIPNVHQSGSNAFYHQRIPLDNDFDRDLVCSLPD